MKYITKNLLMRAAVILILVAILLFVSFYLLHNPGNFGWQWIVFIFLALYFIKEVLEIFSTSFKKWEKGDEAEWVVGKVSAGLPKEFKVIKSIVPGKMGNIDEVVVGPTGIWVIEVKSHNGKITFDGNKLLRNGKPFEKDFLNQTWGEMCAIKDILRKDMRQNFFVQPVLCFAGKYAELNFGFTPIRGVYVIGLKWLNKLITGGAGQNLDNANVEATVKVLDKYKEK